MAKHSVKRSHRNQTGNDVEGNTTNAPDSDFGSGSAQNDDNTSGAPGGSGATSNQSRPSTNRDES